MEMEPLPQCKHRITSPTHNTFVTLPDFIFHKELKFPTFPFLSSLSLQLSLCSIQTGEGHTVTARHRHPSTNTWSKINTLVISRLQGDQMCLRQCLIFITVFTVTSVPIICPALALSSALSLSLLGFVCLCYF